jgi:hypothetical protein
MNSRTGAVVVVLAALLGGLAFSQDPPAPASNQERLDRLELDLAAAKLRIEALSTEVGEAKKKMAATVKYVDEQAKAAGVMMDVLDQSERAGFTYGINADSRHILLRGWRDQLDAAQKDVPELEAPPPAPPPVDRRARRK